MYPDNPSDEEIHLYRLEQEEIASSIAEDISYGLHRGESRLFFNSVDFEE
jgi:hypothetical protein